MNKKGVELPQNVVIIAIIVLVVLVVLIAFFVGGSGTAFSRFSDIFSKGSDDESTAISFCEQYCQTAQNQEASLQSNSNYCTKWFKLDRQPKDGKVDKVEGKYTRYFCSDKHIQDAEGAETGSVGVACEVTC